MVGKQAHEDMLNITSFRGMHIKNGMRYHYIPLAKIKKKLK